MSAVGQQRELCPGELSGLRFYNQRKSGKGEKTMFCLLLCKDVAGKWSERGWSQPRNQVSSWDELPSEGPCLHIGKNPRVAIAKRKQVYLERYMFHRQNAVCLKM